METEWHVSCPNGHRSYERIHQVLPGDVEWTPCPKCGAPRRGELLPPVTGGGGTTDGAL